MTAIELISLLTSSGVCAGGFGVLKWALQMERRVMALELKAGVR